MFLQYVDHGVLQLTEEFVTRLLQEVPDDSPEQVAMKIQVITRLSKVSICCLGGEPGKRASKRGPGKGTRKGTGEEGQGRGPGR